VPPSPQRGDGRNTRRHTCFAGGKETGRYETMRLLGRCSALLPLERHKTRRHRTQRHTNAYTARRAFRNQAQGPRRQPSFHPGKNRYPTPPYGRSGPRLRTPSSMGIRTTPATTSNATDNAISHQPPRSVIPPVDGSWIPGRRFDPSRMPCLPPSPCRQGIRGLPPRQAPGKGVLAVRSKAPACSIDTDRRYLADRR